MLTFWLLVLAIFFGTLVVGSGALYVTSIPMRLPVTMRRAGYIVFTAVFVTIFAAFVSILVQAIINVATGRILANYSALWLIPTCIVSIAYYAHMTRASKAMASALWFVSTTTQIGLFLLLHVYFWESHVLPISSISPTVIGNHESIFCTNCKRGFDFIAHPDLSDEGRNSVTCINCLSNVRQSIKPVVQTGDRIMTIKTRLPRRWEPVIFRMPHKTNLLALSRVVGIPGDKLEIADGDVFINDQRMPRPADQYDSMWLLVNDTQYHPKKVDSDDPGWRPANDQLARWKDVLGNWSITASDADEIVFDRRINDRYEFNDGDTRTRYKPVNDVRLDAQIKNLSGKGDLQMIWQLGGKRLTARFAATGDSSLTDGSQSTKPVSPPKAFETGQTIGLAVRDGVASLLIDDKAVATLVIDSQNVEDHRIQTDSTKPEFCRLSVRADAVDVTLGQILVHRDVYYLGSTLDGCTGCTNNPIQLGPNEYFVLGDNSSRSFDSRHWKEIDPTLQGRFQIGTVPESLMLSVAHWVYWPLSRSRVLE